MDHDAVAMMDVLFRTARRIGDGSLRELAA
jgi:hypothetical protein